jgi:hypothetical protein
METPSQENHLPTPRWKRLKMKPALKAIFLLSIFIVGFGGGYFAGKQSVQMDASRTEANSAKKMQALMDEINPPDGYPSPIIFGDVGPQLLAAEGIDFDAFTALYQQAGRPLSEQQIALLKTGSSEQVVINRENAQFLLNFFWALGLTNQNPVLTDGLLMENAKGQIGNYASTGGWTLGTKPATELYASTQIVSLTPEQQKRLVEVASSVFRPCCDNPTHFPDCNHGMAMLGLLELMASQNASVNEMFATAKYVNAFWFPQQMLEAATFFKATQNVKFADADPRQVVGQKAFSGSGFRSVHQWLTDNGLLQQTPSGGGSCGVQ